ncbi:MAG: DUF3179 domain-containing protein [Alphaproteobacteria bacterium]|nr:DUF3179 domain-containing protein [Alphaproteobacteria bacterium]
MMNRILHVLTRFHLSCVVMLLLLMMPLQNIIAQQEDAFLNDEWKARLAETDFTRTDIALNLLISPLRMEEILDGVSNPEFINPVEGEVIHGTKEPMILVKIGDDVRAYPIRYLLWFRVINDVVGNQPIMVTYNPYNSAFAVYSRVVDGVTYQFTDSGLLYKASILLQDDTTNSLFLQNNGLGAVGALNDKNLTVLTSEYVSFDNFYRRYAETGKLMKAPDITDKDWVIFGATPLTAYESNTISQYYIGKNIPVSDKIRHFDEIISYGQRKSGWSTNYIRNRGEVRINNERVRIRWEAGLNSVHDTFYISQGRDIGMVHVEQQNSQGRWQPIPFYREFMFSQQSFLPGRRVFHDTSLTIN